MTFWFSEMKSHMASISVTSTRDFSRRSVSARRD